MKRLPLLTEENASPVVRAGAVLLIPIGLVMLLPVLLLVVIALYLVAVFQGARICVSFITGRTTPSDFEIQKPHFLELEAPAKSIADDGVNGSESLLLP